MTTTVTPAGDVSGPTFLLFACDVLGDGEPHDATYEGEPVTATVAGRAFTATLIAHVSTPDSDFGDGTHGFQLDGFAPVASTLNLGGLPGPEVQFAGQAVIVPTEGGVTTLQLVVALADSTKTAHFTGAIVLESAHR